MAPERAKGGGPAASAPPTLPERIGRYRILGLLGKGGMGSVSCICTRTGSRRPSSSWQRFDEADEL